MFYKSSPRTNPTPSNGRWLMADLHVHSTFSGGALAPAELSQNAQMQLLDAIAISDHNEIAGAFEAQKIAGPNDFEIIVSQEISLGDHFHLLILGAQEAWTGSRNKLVEKIHQSHEAGAAIILAHPWTLPKSSWASDCLQDLLAGKLIDGAELFNASILEAEEKGAEILTSVWEDLIIPYHLAVIGGSDFHYYKQGRWLGAGRTYLKVSSRGGLGILEAIRKRRSVAGLFSYRPFDLGIFGVGTRTLRGRDPWYTELRELITSLNQQISCFEQINPARYLVLKRLMAAGYYQLVRDLLTGG
ncbi:MAG: CehA/McbA family metallohydrolase [Firmicutes bacterium]|nr:CehA/McbA family metallohydrolase [Bacillota bacterium]